LSVWEELEELFCLLVGLPGVLGFEDVFLEVAFEDV